MLADPRAHWDYLENEWRAAKAAPLSLRKAMVVVGLLDAFADRMAVAGEHDDVLAFRAGLAENSPALTQVFGLASHRDDGPRLQVQAVAVPVGEMGRLPVEDFMVSLYNNHSVQRLMVVASGMAPVLAHEVLAEAVAALQSAGIVDGAGALSTAEKN